MSIFYSISQFCKFTGVSKRTLQYYDEIGLLTPIKNSNGYRRYSTCNLLTLQQILTLKHLGLSIAHIKEVTEQDEQEVDCVLMQQVQSLHNRAHVLKKTACLVEDAVLLREYAGEFDWSLIAGAVRALQSNTVEQWFQNFYSKEELLNLNAIWSGLSNDKVESYIVIFTQLVNDIHMNALLDPTDLVSQSIATRFYDLALACYGSYPLLMKKVLVTYRAGMFETSSIPLLNKDGFIYLIQSLATIGKLTVFL
ncbi:MAG: MerR family transcriptional regulator [Coxiellaceae bacterium]|nr:MerR family transcriptional regulator [Coxiellaceae bacterium]